MTATATDTGLEFPKLPLARTLQALFLILPCILASIIASASRPGSIIVLCFLLPLALPLRDLWPRRRELRVQFQTLMAAGALLGVALEPGWLNLTVSWLLVVGLAIEARSEGTHAALAGLRAVAWAIAVSPFGVLFASATAALRLPVKASHISRIPFTSLVLPVLAVLVFAPLLAAANPRFEDLLSSLDFGNPLAWLDHLAALLFTFESFIFLPTLLMLWPVLHGKNAARTTVLDDTAQAPLWHVTFFKPLAVATTLVLLNLMFAIENSLDIQHLWLDPRVVGSYSHPEYVHRGAYTLIFTAALAGLLMLTALRKGTATEASPLVRLLVYGFAAQNLLLVASSAQRTLLYIDAYGWTEWRVSGLAWMALVFFGLLTIFWRVAKNRDSRWLVNTNIFAATVMLVGFSLWDMQGYIIERNVARAMGEAAPMLDSSYVNELSTNALPALRRYQSFLASQHHPNSTLQASLPILAESRRIALVIYNLDRTGPWHQSDWQSWTLRDAAMAQN